MKKQLGQKNEVIAKVEKCGIEFTLTSCEKGEVKWLLIEAYNTFTQEEVGFVLLNTKTEVEYQCGVFDYVGIPELYDYIENELFKQEVSEWADNLDCATTR